MVYSCKKCIRGNYKINIVSFIRNSDDGRDVLKKCESLNYTGGNNERTGRCYTTAGIKS